MWCMRSERGMLLRGRYVSLQALLSFTNTQTHPRSRTYIHTHTHTHKHAHILTCSLARSLVLSFSRAHARACPLIQSPTTIYVRHLERTQGTLKVRLERTQAILQVHTLKMLRSLSDTPMTHC